MFDVNFFVYAYLYSFRYHFLRLHICARRRPRLVTVTLLLAIVKNLNLRQLRFAVIELRRNKKKTNRNGSSQSSKRHVLQQRQLYLKQASFFCTQLNRYRLSRNFKCNKHQEFFVPFDAVALDDHLSLFALFSVLVCRLHAAAMRKRTSDINMVIIN